MDRGNDLALLLGRLLMAALFLPSFVLAKSMSPPRLNVVYRREARQ